MKACSLANLRRTCISMQSRPNSHNAPNDWDPVIPCTMSSQIRQFRSSEGFKTFSTKLTAWLAVYDEEVAATDRALLDLLGMTGTDQPRPAYQEIIRAKFALIYQHWAVHADTSCHCTKLLVFSTCAHIGCIITIGHLAICLYTVCTTFP